MDERLKYIAENLKSLTLGVDDTFKFHCDMCGKCCINREDILLNPQDIYRMAKELKMEPKDMFIRYCETYVGDNSRIPIVRIQPRGSIKRCPLMANHKCSVHKAKLHWIKQIFNISLLNPDAVMIRKHILCGNGLKILVFP